jgi:uncharacterized membrane protein
MIQVTVTSKTGIKSSAVTNVLVGRAIPIAVVDASEKTVYYRRSVVIDGSLSYDSDFPEDKSHLQYEWVCFQLAPNFGDSCAIPSSVVTTNAILEIPKETLASNGKYRFTLSVKVSGIDSSASASTIITINAGLPLPIMTISGFKTKQNPDERLVLSSSIDTEYAYSVAEWTAFNNDGIEISLNQIARSNLRQILSYGYSNFGLTVGANTLTPGVSYSFVLTSSYVPDGTNSMDQATVKCVIVVNTPPAGGQFSLVPQSGSALSTVFYFFSSMWADDVEDYPLMYKYSAYTTTPQTSSLLRDFAPVSSASGYLAQGIKNNNFGVSCVLEIADNLGCAASVVRTATVTASSSRDLFAKAQDMYKDESEDSENTRQVISALLGTLNAANCTGISGCSSTYNRQPCQTTPGTCGPCIPGFPIGESGDANSKCFAKASDATVSFLNGISGQGETMSAEARSSVSNALKSCPFDCSGRGVCTFADFFGNHVSTCSVLDAGCRAKCSCNAGFYGVDCLRSGEDQTLAENLKEFTSQILYANRFLEDVTSAVVLLRAKTITELLEDMTDVTDATYSNCALLLFETISQYTSLCTEDTNMPVVVNALSALLERGTMLTDSHYASILASLRLLSESRQRKSSVGEAPFKSSSPNLRYFVAKEYLGSFRKDNVWALPGSVLEEALDLELAEISISSTLALNASIQATTSIVGLSMWEILINTGRNLLNSSAVEVQARLMSGSDFINLPGDSITSILRNHNPVTYSTPQPLTRRLQCRRKRDLLPYKVVVTCPNDFSAELVCPGNSSSYFDYTCPYAFTMPQCHVQDAFGVFKPSPDCTVISYTSDETVCSCKSSVAMTSFSRRLTGGGPSSSTFVLSSSMFINSKSFESVFTHVAYVSPEDIAQDYIVFSTLGALVAGLIVLVFILGVYDRRGPSNKNYNPDGSSSTEPEPANLELSPIFDILSFIMPEEMARKPWFSRFRQHVVNNSEYLLWIGTYEHRYLPSRVEKVLLVFGYILNFMVVHAILAMTIYPDDGYCSTFSDERTCEEKQSVLMVRSVCSWDGAFCDVNQPSNQFIETFILLLAAAICVVPLNFFLKLSVKHIVSTSAFQRFVGFSSFQKVYSEDVNVDDSPAEPKIPDTPVRGPKGQRNYSGDSGVHTPLGKNTIRKSNFTTPEMLRNPDDFPSQLDEHREVPDGEFSFYKYPNYIGSLTTEANYIYEEARVQVVQAQQEENVFSESSILAADFRRRLSLTPAGEVTRFGSLSQCFQKPQVLLEADILRARVGALFIHNVVELLPNQQSIRDIFLLEEFLINNLPRSLRYFAHKLCLSMDLQYRATSESIISNFGVISLLVVYLAGVFALLISFGTLNGSKATITWLINVAINVSCDIFLIIPFRVFFMDIVIHGALMKKLAVQHAIIKHRYKSIIKRALKHSQGKSDKNSDSNPENAALASAHASLKLLQHLNPACRAARMVEHTSTTLFLTFVGDMDLRLRSEALSIGTAADDELDQVLQLQYSYGWTGSVARSYNSILLSCLKFILACVPISFGETSVELILSGIVPFTILFIYYLGIWGFVFLPIIIVLAIVLVVVLLELYRSAEAQRQLVHKSGMVDVDLAAGMVAEDVPDMGATAPGTAAFAEQMRQSSLSRNPEALHRFELAVGTLEQVGRIRRLLLNDEIEVDEEEKKFMEETTKALSTPGDVANQASIRKMRLAKKIAVEPAPISSDEQRVRQMQQYRQMMIERNGNREFLDEAYQRQMLLQQQMAIMGSAGQQLPYDPRFGPGVLDPRLYPFPYQLPLMQSGGLTTDDPRLRENTGLVDPTHLPLSRTNSLQRLPPLSGLPRHPLDSHVDSVDEAPPQQHPMHISHLRELAEMQRLSQMQLLQQQAQAPGATGSPGTSVSAGAPQQRGFVSVFDSQRNLSPMREGLKGASPESAALATNVDEEHSHSAYQTNSSIIAANLNQLPPSGDEMHGTSGARLPPIISPLPIGAGSSLDASGGAKQGAGKGKVQMSYDEYKMLSGTIASVFVEEEALHGGQAVALPQRAVADEVFRRVFGLSDITPEAAAENKETFKIIDKVIRRMIYKESALLISEASESRDASNRLLQLTPDDTSRRALLKHALKQVAK